MNDGVRFCILYNQTIERNHSEGVGGNGSTVQLTRLRNCIEMDNFRKNYYSTLGVKSVEVQSSLTIALNEEPLNISKLQKLCLWVRIPHSYRPLVWKVLLKCWPTFKKMWEFAQGNQQDEIHQILNCIKRICESDISDDELLTRGVLLCVQSLDTLSPIEFLNQIQKKCPDHLISLSKAFQDISTQGMTEAFILFRGFLQQCSVPLDVDQDSYFISNKIDLMAELLKVHDYVMYTHLEGFKLEKCSWYGIMLNFKQ